MDPQQIAQAHQRSRAALARRLEAEAARAWARVSWGNIAASWATQLVMFAAAVEAAQRAAAAAADAYTAKALAAQGIDPGEATVNPDAFVGASDGRSLIGLLAWPAIAAKIAQSRGADERRARAAGLASLRLIAATQVADAGRAADQASLTARGAEGYVRVIVGATCSRCTVLAGRYYAFNAGFKRHPKCDCTHMPTNRNKAKPHQTDPRKTFDSLSRAEQDRVYTKAGAEAIRNGADPAQVVNARRGMQTAVVFGRQTAITREGITGQGLAGRRLGDESRGVRLMPEEIFRLSGGNRDEAIRLLRRFGYIL